jgi:hypothetical protein
MFGLRMVLSSINRGSQAPTLIETPLWIPQLSIPIGLSVLLVALALTVADMIGFLLLLYLIPSLVTWLPGVMFGG